MKYMSDNVYITTMDAATKLFVGDLQGVVKALKNDGQKIDSFWVDTVNHYGRPVRYKKYFMSSR